MKSLPLAQLALALLAVCSSPALATPTLMGKIPSAPQSCNTCHTSGGGTPRNAFGLQLEAQLSGSVVDWPTLCLLDADGDNESNGAELGDPCCVWLSGAAPFATTGNPSNAAVTSGNTCAPSGDAGPTDAGGGTPDAGAGTPDAGAGTLDAGANTPDAGVPAEFVCPAAWYGTGDGCDCGCGLLDPDCADATYESCDTNSCPGAEDGFVPDPEDPTRCIEAAAPPAAPAGWTCDAQWYGAGDGCDCGCGIVDTDCSDTSWDGCDTNSCKDAPDAVPAVDDPTQCVAQNRTSDEAPACRHDRLSPSNPAPVFSLLVGLVAVAGLTRRRRRGNVRRL